MHNNTHKLPDPMPEPSVRHYVAGGTEHGGGIGRLIGYILASHPQNSHDHRVTDTRGPRWDKLRSPFILWGAMALMIKDRLVAPGRVHHLHIAGRGSTARKLVLGACARTLGCTHVLHLHDFDYAADFLRRPIWQRRAIRALFRGADRVIVLGERDRATATELLGVPPRSIGVLHNAVPDPQQGRDALAKTQATAPQADPQGTPCKIVFLGQLGPRKGVPELLSALAHPNMQSLNWSAVLAGDGPVDEYHAEAERLGLLDRVSLPGWLGSAETRALCERSDILVLPSHGEGMAMAVLEGLAHGLAVVTTRVGAHEEILRDWETCLFVPVGDVEALANALGNLVAHPEMRAKLAQAGRAHYLNALSIDAYVGKLDALHRSVSQGALHGVPTQRGAA